MYPRNLAELHQQQTQRSGPRTAVRCKRFGLYRDVSWDAYWLEAQAVAAGLIAAGVQPGDRVGLLAENRFEWLAIDMGIMAAAAVNVPAHPPLSSRQLAEQFTHAEICWLFVSTPAQYSKIRAVRSALPAVRGVVTIEPVPDADAIPWDRFRVHGRQMLPAVRAEIARRTRALASDDLATIMYTSGTTGNSKGVMLTHGNLLSNALSMLDGTGVTADDVVLNWLPFSHIYGRLVDHYVHLAAGCTLCLAESQETLVHNLSEISPTCFAAVPRFYEKVLAAVSGLSAEQAGHHLRSIFGPRIRRLNSGGAPLPVHIAEAFERAGLTILQGYGLTESSPVITFNRQGANRMGTVGQPIAGVEVCIADDGEILTRGPHVMKGYWKDAAATADAIRDGWLHTGDLGALDADGYLTVTGRKKDLLVLSNGKKVVPAEIENMLIGQELIDQAVVHGEGKNFLTALIVPAFDKLRDAGRRQGIANVEQMNAPALVGHPQVRKLIEQQVQQALGNLASYEQVRKFIVLPRPLTQEAEELTVSLKVRRNVILKKFAAELEALYAEPLAE